MPYYILGNVQYNVRDNRAYCTTRVRNMRKGDLWQCTIAQMHTTVVRFVMICDEIVPVVSQSVTYSEYGNRSTEQEIQLATVYIQ